MEAIMTNLFETPKDLGEYLFRITDNGGRSADRYTVAFSDGSYLALSGSPTHPLGVSQSGEDIDVAGWAERVENGEEIDLALGDLPEHIVSHILYRNNEGFRDFLEAVETCVPSAVADTREAAQENEGLGSSLGVGIYKSDKGYMVKKNAPESDFGPYVTAREAVLATLPDHYSCSGPEYHSTVDVTSLEPTEGVKEKIAALEAAVDSELKAHDPL